MDEILKECKEIIDEVCEKYEYDSKDKEENDSLRTVLLKAVPSMLKDAKQEERELFYQMLTHTPIVITENLTKEGYNELVEQYIGDINQHIIEEEMNLGEYGKNIGAGAYVSEPIIDENMQIRGKKSFIYIQKVPRRAKEFFGTEINVSHLIHELGHAWHAEKDEYIMQEDGTLKDRVGTAEFIYSFSKGKDNKYVQKCEKNTGLMIEEGMNTIAEEKAMANYMGISLEEMRKEYRSSLVPSNYQGNVSCLVEYMLEELHKEDFESWRLYGDLESKTKIENLMKRTEYWQHRETDILSSSDSQRNYDKKREVISRMKMSRVQDFFRDYEDVYFPNVSQMTPLEKIENVLTQYYNMNMIKYSMEIDNYKGFIERLGYEGYSLINQSADLRKNDELSRVINGVRVSELDSITRETVTKTMRPKDKNIEDSNKGEELHNG